VLFASTAVACWLADLQVQVTSRRSARIVASVLCLVAAGDLVWRNSARFDGIFDQEPLKQRFRLLRPAHAMVTDTTIDAYKQDAPMLRALMANRSTFNCYEPLRVKRLSDPDAPLVFVQDDTAMVSSVFTPNRIQVTLATTRQPARLFVNENFAPGWRSTLGPVSPDPRYGNIAVAVPAGAAGDYTIRFSPPGFALGWLIWIVAVVVSVPIWRAAKPDEARHPGSTAPPTNS
jgi:hypothetical protein